MAATQLTAAYCDALVQDTGLRRDLFPGFDFSLPVADAGINWRGDIVEPLVDRAIGLGLLPDSVRDDIIDELELLIVDDRDLKPYIFSNGRWISDPNPAAHTKRDGLIYCDGNRHVPRPISDRETALESQTVGTRPPPCFRVGAHRSGLVA